MGNSKRPKRIKLNTNTSYQFAKSQNLLCQPVTYFKEAIEKLKSLSVQRERACFVTD